MFSKYTFKWMAFISGVAQMDIIENVFISFAWFHAPKLCWLGLYVCLDFYTTWIAVCCVLIGIHFSAVPLHSKDITAVVLVCIYTWVHRFDRGREDCRYFSQNKLIFWLTFVWTRIFLIRRGHVTFAFTHFSGRVKIPLSKHSLSASYCQNRHISQNVLALLQICSCLCRGWRWLRFCHHAV